MLAGTVCAATGQVLFKLGADGRSYLVELINPLTGAGFIFYAVGAVLWIRVLSSTPLSVVYPFTVLTFVLVYGASIMILGERPTRLGLVGVFVVLVGLYLVIASRPEP